MNSLHLPVSRDGQKRESMTLAMDGVSASGGRAGLSPCHVAVRQGEVVGLAGLEGSGQGLFLRLAAGLERPETGKIRVAGEDMTGKDHHAYRARRVTFLPAGRLEEGLMPGLTITEHFALHQEQGMMIHWPKARERAEQGIERFRIRGSPLSAAESLSGGNQQRLLLALLPANPSLLLLEHPTRGLDMDSVQWVWEKLMAYAARGNEHCFFFCRAGRDLSNGRSGPRVFQRGRGEGRQDLRYDHGGACEGHRRQRIAMLLFPENSRPKELLIRAFFIAGGVFCLTSLVLLVAGAPPWPAFYHLFVGALGSWSKLAQVLMVWIPLTLCACGLLYSFRIGLWNIGVEGQVVAGAIASTAVLRFGVESGSPSLMIVMAFAGGMLGGSVWAILAGFLKTKGGVNEIFGGLGLNFVAQGITLWLIFGPWKRPGVGSMSGTEALP